MIQEPGVFTSLYTKDPEKFTATFNAVVSAFTRGLALVGGDLALAPQPLPPDMEAQVDTLLEDSDSASVAKRLMETGMSRAAAEKASKRIDDRLMEALDSFPGPEETKGIQGGCGDSPYYWVLFHIARFISRRVTELIAQEAQLVSPVRIPSDAAIVPLFTAGAPVREMGETFQVMKRLEDGIPKAVSIEIGLLPNEGDQLCLEYDDPEFFLRPKIARSLNSGRWREEALSILPEILGPAALSVYFWTWADCDDSGVILIEPSEVARALGLSNQTNTRNRISKIVDTLTRVTLVLNRKYGPNMGAKDKEVDYSGRLILPSNERLEIRDLPRDGSRGPRRIGIYRHALPMISIRREYNVGIPREAFKLVGEWDRGAGQKAAGYQALTLVANAYIQARTFATRTGKQGVMTYLGPQGFEAPLEDVLTRAGFVRPGEFTEHPGFHVARARDAVDRLVNGFGLFGKGSEVFMGDGGVPYFRFVTRDDLRKQLAGIAQAQPEKIAEAVARKAKRRGRKPSPTRKK